MSRLQFSLICLAFFFSACQTSPPANTNGNAAKPESSAATPAGEPKLSEAKSPVFSSTAPDSSEPVKLKAWDPGTTVVVQDGANKKPAKVIRVAGNNVLVMEAGKLKVYPKSSCQPAPLVPQVKAGDRVQAPRYGINFAGASVSSVDTRNGRVFLRFEGDKEDKAIAFGDVLTN